MLQSCTDVFEQELRRREIAFTRDSESGRHVVERADGTRMLISLDNLSRGFERDKDAGRISRFVDMILAGGGWPQSWDEACPKLLLALEPRHFAEPRMWPEPSATRWTAYRFCSIPTSAR